MAPVVPGITTSKRVLEATISAIAAHGAAFVGANVLHLEGGTRDHFFEFLGREYPHLVDGYQRLYANGAKRVPREYAKAVSAKVRGVARGDWADGADGVGCVRCDGCVRCVRVRK